VYGVGEENEITEIWRPLVEGDLPPADAFEVEVNIRARG